MTHAFIEVDAAGLDEAIAAAGERLLLVYCWGPRCPNCDLFAAEVPSLLAALPEGPLRLAKINVYEHDAVATRYGLYGIPAFLLFRRGRLLGRMSRYHSRSYWLAVVTEQMRAVETM